MRMMSVGGGDWDVSSWIGTERQTMSRLHAFCQSWHIGQYTVDGHRRRRFVTLTRRAHVALHCNDEGMLACLSARGRTKRLACSLIYARALHPSLHALLASLLLCKTKSDLASSQPSNTFLGQHHRQIKQKGSLRQGFRPPFSK